MTIVEAVILGVIQGVTEFLPVSSTAHLSLAEYFLGLAETPRFFDVMLHLGTLAAITAYYRESLLALVWKRPPSAEKPTKPNLPRITPRLFLLVCLATLPAVAAGLVFRPHKRGETVSQPEGSFTAWRRSIGDLREYSSEKPLVVCAFLTLTGALVIAASRVMPGNTEVDDVTVGQALAFGIAQGFSAILPGLSRSGSTISTALFCGLEAQAAVHFSLLMSVPAVLGAAVLKTKDVDWSWLTTPNLIATAIGTVVAGVVGWACIHLLIRSVQRDRWWCFGVYVLVLAAVAAASVGLVR